MQLLDLFLDHWRSIPKSGPMPRLGDYLERPNTTTQPWTLILDVTGQGFPTRLFGTALVDLMGTDLTGTDHLALFPEAERPNSLRRHNLIITVPCGMYSTAHAQTQKGVLTEMEGLTLPLIRDDGAFSVVRIIRVVQKLGYSDRVAKVLDVGPDSRWLDLGHGVPDEN